MKKKIILFVFVVSIFVTLIMTATMYASATTAMPESMKHGSNEALVPLYAGAESAVPMSTDDVVSAQFSISADVTFVGVSCPSWSDNIGDMTVTLYKFNKDYETTIAGEPISSEIFEGFGDNNLLGFNFEENDPLKAGEYVIRLTDAFDSGGSGVGVWKHGAYAGQIYYVDDMPVEDSSLRIEVLFVQTPEGEPYGPLTRDSSTGEINKLPDIDNMIIFNDEEMLDLITPGVGCQNFEIIDGYLRINVTPAADSQFVINMPYWANKYLSCEEYGAMLVKMRVSEGAPLTGEVFFSTSTFPGPAAGGSVTATYQNTTDWQYVIFNFNSNGKYSQPDAILNKIRFDPFTTENQDAVIDIEYILFFTNKESAQTWDGVFDFIPPAPTQVPSTPTPQITQAPATEIPATEAPSTDAAPPTAQNKPKSGGCGSSCAIAQVMLVLGVALIIKKKK